MNIGCAFVQVFIKLDDNDFLWLASVRGIWPRGSLGFVPSLVIFFNYTPLVNYGLFVERICWPPLCSFNNTGLALDLGFNSVDCPCTQAVCLCFHSWQVSITIRHFHIVFGFGIHPTRHSLLGSRSLYSFHSS